MVYDYSRVSRVQQRRNRRSRVRQFFVISVFFFVIASMLYGLSGLFFAKSRSTEFLSPIVAPIQESVDTSIQGFTMLFSSGLKDTVENSLKESNGTYGIYIKNLKTGEHYAVNEHEQFISASLYKLWTMGTVYTLIEQGKLQKTDVLSANVEELNKQFNIASDEAELTEGSINRTVDEAVEQMITISHNYSALLLTSRITLSNVRNFLSTYGLTESVVGSDLPKTTAADIGKYYELLYAKKIVNDIYSEEMMALLKRQRLNDRIPKELPESVQVAHKTGELYGYKHDAGIVFAPFGDYIIVVLSDSKDPATAAIRTAKLSKDVYEYFDSKE